MERKDITTRGSSNKTWLFLFHCINGQSLDPLWGVAHQTKSLSGYTHSSWHGNIQIPPQGRNSLFLMQHYGACVVFQWRGPKKSLGVLWGPWWDRTAVWPCFLQLCSWVLRWKRGRWHQKSIAPPPQDLLLTSHSPQLVWNSFLKTPHSQSSWMQSTKEQLRQGLGCHSCSGREGINIHDLQ